MSGEDCLLSSETAQSWVHVQPDCFGTNGILLHVLPDDEATCHFSLSLVQVGDWGPGKLSFHSLIAQDVFPKESHAMFMDSTQCVVSYRDLVEDTNFSIKLQLSERSLTVGLLAGAHLRGCHGLILSFDVCNRNSFEQLLPWMEGIASCSLHLTQCLLVGVRDRDSVAEEDRAVSKEEAMALASRYQVPYVECCSTCAAQARDALALLVHRIIRAHSVANSLWISSSGALVRRGARSIRVHGRLNYLCSVC